MSLDLPLTRQFYTPDPLRGTEIRNVTGLVATNFNPNVNLINNINEIDPLQPELVYRDFFTVLQIDYEVSVAQVSPSKDLSSLVWAIAILQDGEKVFENLPLNDTSITTNVARAFFEPEDKLARTGCGFTSDGSVYTTKGSIRGEWVFANNAVCNFYLRSPDGVALRAIVNAKIYLL